MMIDETYALAISCTGSMTTRQSQLCRIQRCRKLEINIKRLLLSHYFHICNPAENINKMPKYHNCFGSFGRREEEENITKCPHFSQHRKAFSAFSSASARSAGMTYGIKLFIYSLHPPKMTRRKYYLWWGSIACLILCCLFVLPIISWLLG